MHLDNRQVVHSSFYCKFQEREELRKYACLCNSFYLCKRDCKHVYVFIWWDKAAAAKVPFWRMGDKDTTLPPSHFLTCCSSNYIINEIYLVYMIKLYRIYTGRVIFSLGLDKNKNKKCNHTVVAPFETPTVFLLLGYVSIFSPLHFDKF